MICYFFDNISDSAGLQTSSVVYCVLPKAKEVTHMAKITIEELFYGGKYILPKSALVDFPTDDFAVEIVHKSTWHMNTILLFVEKK